MKNADMGLTISAFSEFIKVVEQIQKITNCDSEKIFLS